MWGPSLVSTRLTQGTGRVFIKDAGKHRSATCGTSNIRTALKTEKQKRNGEQHPHRRAHRKGAAPPARPGPPPIPLFCSPNKTRMYVCTVSKMRHRTGSLPSRDPPDRYGGYFPATDTRGHPSLTTVTTRRHQADKLLTRCSLPLWANAGGKMKQVGEGNKMPPLLPQIK